MQLSCDWLTRAATKTRTRRNRCVTRNTFAPKRNSVWRYCVPETEPPQGGGGSLSRRSRLKSKQSTIRQIRRRPEERSFQNVCDAYSRRQDRPAHNDFRSSDESELTSACSGTSSAISFGPLIQEDQARPLPPGMADLLKKLNIPTDRGGLSEATHGSSRRSKQHRCEVHTSKEPTGC